MRWYYGVTFKLKRIAVTVAAVTAAAVVLMCSAQMRDGVRDGISLCLTSVVPSLFLFTAVALFLSHSGCSEVLGKLISPVTRVLFGLDGVSATVFLLSCVSGYPVGARLIDSHLKNGRLTRSKALKMLTFSVNAGPAFIVVAVGKGVLGSASDGWRLVLAHIAASCIIAAAVRFMPDRWFSDDRSPKTDKPRKTAVSYSLSDTFVMSVNDAAKTMLTVCAFVVFFAGVGAMVKELPHGRTVQSLLEVTVGVQGCARSQLPKVAFLLGFGGISVIFQVMSAAQSVRPPFMLIILSRLIHGLVSFGLILLFEAVCPRTVSAGSFNVAGTAAVHTSPLAAAGLLLLCVVLIGFTQRVSVSADRS